MCGWFTLNYVNIWHDTKPRKYLDNEILFDILAPILSLLQMFEMMLMRLVGFNFKVSSNSN